MGLYFSAFIFMLCTDHPPSCYNFQHSSIVPVSGLLYKVKNECLAQRPCMSVTYCQRLNCLSDFREIHFFAKLCWAHKSFRKIGSMTVNPLTPNDLYMSRTAPLTNKHCILCIYSTNVDTEYFKHAPYSPFFFSLKCSLFRNANLFGSCIHSFIH